MLHCPRFNGKQREENSCPISMNVERKIDSRVRTKLHNYEPTIVLEIYRDMRNKNAI